MYHPTHEYQEHGYNLAGSAEDRVRFDESAKRSVQDALSTLTKEDVLALDAGDYISVSWDIFAQELDVDDLNEAEARFVSVAFRVVRGEQRMYRELITE